jgi:hypothetical protein
VSYTTQTGKFWSLGIPKNFGCQGGQQIWEVREAGKFGKLGKSTNFGYRELLIDWEGGSIGRILSPVINVFLKLHVNCLSFR